MNGIYTIPNNPPPHPPPPVAPGALSLEISLPPGGEMVTGNIFGVLFGCRGTFWGTHSVTLSFLNFDNIYMFIMAKNGNFQFSEPLTKKLGGDGR